MKLEKYFICSLLLLEIHELLLLETQHVLLGEQET